MGHVMRETELFSPWLSALSTRHCRNEGVSAPLCRQTVNIWIEKSGVSRVKGKLRGELY